MIKNRITATVEGIKPGVYDTIRADIMAPQQQEGPWFLQVPDGVTIKHSHKNGTTFCSGALISSLYDQYYTLLRIAQEQGVEVVIPDD